MSGIVLDPSAVVAIIQGEPGADRLVRALEQADPRCMSAAGVVEAGIVLQARFGDHGERELDAFLLRARVDVVAVSAEHADLARQAFRRFGRGRHPAGLNFGDCFSYALAVALALPLLHVGADFSQTDLATVD